MVLDFTQQRRSSRNSRRKTACRLGARFNLDLPSQPIHRPWLDFPKFRAPQRGQQAPGISGRAEEVGRLE